MPRLIPKDVTSLRYRAASGKAQVVLYDAQGTGKGDAVPGFGVRVYESGAKSYVLRYRPHGSRSPRMLKLGRPQELSVQAARKLAAAKLAEVAMGGDPARERRRAREGTTVKQLATLYLERHASGLRSGDATRRRLERHVLPRLGAKKLDEVASQDVRRLHSSLTAAGKTVEANRVLALVRGMFNRATEWGLLPDTAKNPATGVRPNRERSRDRYVLPTELPALLSAIDAESDPYIRAAFRLYLLTGLRRSELLALKWDHVDLKERTLHLPRTKAGRAHRLPLSQPAVDILRDLPRRLGNPYVIAGHVKGKPLVNVAKPWRRIRARAWLALHPDEATKLRARAERLVTGRKKRGKHASDGVAAVEAQLLRLADKKAQAGDVLRLHDLRRTVGSWLAMGGASLPLIGKVLNHSNASTTQIYARLADEAPRAALEELARRMQAAAASQGTT